MTMRSVRGSPAPAGIDPFGGQIALLPMRTFGSPAPAGIDPQVALERRVASDGRFPRTRGDRPADCEEVHWEPRLPVPPHPRGYTLRRRRLETLQVQPGSPAPAGIDLLMPVPLHVPVVRWFPRTRGDRPATWFWTEGVGVAEGSPAPAGIDPDSKHQLVHRPGLGSPAPAGIDPSLVDHDTNAPHRRFPRTRGDRPQSAHDTNAPHWRRGSPAPAGIDLRISATNRLTFRRVVPPHPRG